MKILKGDNVQIMTGKDKGKSGAVVRVFVDRAKVVIEGINEYKRHTKGRFQGQKSEIVTLNRPLPMSVVALVCKKCKKPTRVGFELKNEKKLRICRRCKSEI
jgi:large subunit ribosomal protein L24